MKLTHFQIKNYKVIDDTGLIPVDEHVTALVGKNESGKTAILRALWKTKNVANAKFDKLLDYPRERYAKERFEKQEVVTLKFELTDAEAEELSGQFPSEFNVKPTEIIFTSYYKGEEETETHINFDEKTEKEFQKSSVHAKKRIQEVAQAVMSNGSDDGTVSKAKSDAENAINEDLPLWDKGTVTQLTSFQSTVSNWISGDESRKQLASKELGKLSTLIGQAKEGDPAQKARSWVLQNLPTFIYFDDYGQLETRLNLPLYLTRVKSPDVKTRTQAALFEWSNLNPEEILTLGKPQDGEEEEARQRRKDKRRALLDSASFGLTGDWIKWWTEKRHKLSFDADGDDLVLRVSDEYNEFPIPFEERSHGFQWFFSFYLVFLVESKQAHKGAILLLDEPGLHLHPTMQSSLIGLFERISGTNQLIYTTHLPFLVDGNHLERVRTTYLEGDRLEKAVVSSNTRLAGDRDTLFPLQAAIGYSMAQTLFLGKRSLIVEGITDYWIAKALTGCLAALGKGPTLQEDTVIIPSGGISRMMPLASIMFGASGVGGRQMLVLLDSDSTGIQAAKRFERDLFGDNSRILMLGQAVGLKKATIEDLVARDSYAAAVGACGYNFKLNDEEKQEETNVAAMEKVFKRKGFGTFGTDQKAWAVLRLIEEWGKDPKSVPETTLKKACMLFTAVNARFKSYAKSGPETQNPADPTR